MNHTATIRNRFAVALSALALLSGCKPIEEGTAPPGQVTRDPSGLVIPIPVANRNTAASHQLVVCLSNASEPHQRVQVNLLIDLLRQATDFGLTATDAKGSADAQIQQLTSLVTTKPTAVLILPVDAAAEKESIETLRKAGTLVIGLDASLNDDTCDSVVFCDQKKIGAAAGGLIVSALQKKAQEEGSTEVKGRVVQIQGDQNHPSCRARSEGFLSAIKAQSGIILVHDAPAMWDKANAMLRFKEAVKLQKSIDAVYAHNDMLALGVSEASIDEKIRESLFIVGTDGVSGPGGGLEMLHKSQIDATVHQPLLVDFAWRLVEKMSKDKTFKPKSAYEIEPVVFTPKNVEELQAKGLPVPEF